MATRWACIGTGRIAGDFFHSIKDHLSADDHENVAVASSELSKAQQFAEEFGFKKAYGSYDEVSDDEDVEVVYIATMHTNHMQLSIKMLKAGKHVLCEKPMAMNLKEAKQVMEAAKASKRLFVEGMWTRYLPAIEHMRKELEARSLGDIRLVQATLVWNGMGWQPVMDRQHGMGILLCVGSYLMSFATMVFNEMPETIKAVALLSDVSGDGEIDTGGSILLKYKCGAIACLSYHMEPKVHNNSAVVMGTEGTIEIGAPFYAPEKVTTPSGTLEFPCHKGNYNYPYSAGLHYEATAVRDAILKGKLEIEACPLSHSEISLAIMDEVRRQIGMDYPGFD